ncbi:MAG: hypothetical protein PHH75_06025 [Candidatus Omnitrophica bacterium]|nr:hypothetical protein [Candidatus Omnitrophota bacterium]MDD5574720.1 hypothetical protein [Candidatus Omnitrophota bacterium]
MKNVLTQRLKTLPGPMADFIRQAGMLADEMGLPAYLVGGFVRDLLLGVGHFDVDLVVEGDGIRFARECARRLSMRLVAHGRFGTATLYGRAGFKADIASSRKESYEKPAALPTVSCGQIKDDLSRRDFTINAMAIGINQHSYGDIFDFYGGRDDLKNRVVRALHPLSFTDDPTRILRAVRFECRLAFRIEPATMAWMRCAAREGMLERVQKHRLRDELILIFKEHQPFGVLRRLHDFCGYGFISPGLTYRRAWMSAYAKIREAALWFEQNLPHKRCLDIYVMSMCLFFSPLSLRRIGDAILAYAFHKGEGLRILSFKTHAGPVERQLSKKNLAPSHIYRLLEPLAYEVIVLIYALSTKAIIRKRIRDFLLIYHGTRLHVRGEDLAGLGSRPGPHFKKVLTGLLYAKVDGKVRDRQEELVLAKRLLERS